MSKSRKRPISIDPRERRADRLVQVMATQVADQAMLDKLLEGATPVMRRQMLDTLGPYLPFVPREDMTEDCPACGFRRGTIISHECVTEPPDSAA